MVITTDTRLSKLYERVILEEYYYFFKKMGYNSGSIFPRTIKFTTDIKKLRNIDKNDECLMESIKACNSFSDENIRLFLHSDKKRPEDDIDALARVKVDLDNIHIGEFLFLDYPSEEEKLERINEILSAIEDFARNNGIETVSLEIPKCDDLEYDLAKRLGYEIAKEEPEAREIFTTFLFEKSMNLTRDKNEWTRSRKQGKKSN